MIRPKAIDAIPINDYCVCIVFDNGEVRIFDVKPYLNHNAYAELANPLLFQTVKPAGLRIEWIHGQDICPDCLYYNSVPHEYQEIA